MMKDYSEVTTQDELDALIDSFGDFHDSMTKEIHMVNRGGVLADHTMLMKHQFDAQIIIQSQWQPYAIELLFCDVLQFSIDDALDYVSTTGSVKQESIANETLRVELKFDTAVKISARRLFFRVQPDYLGIGARLRSEVPSPTAIGAKLIEGGWRQCLDCTETWEDDPQATYSVCPKCLVLTELRD
jgi:hypothetical protein